MKYLKQCKNAAISLIVIGCLMFFGTLINGTEHIEYGGDAYTGIQNASADTANNVLKACGILVASLGMVLFNYSNIKAFEYEESERKHQELLKALGVEIFTDNEDEHSSIDINTETKAESTIDTTSKEGKTLTDLIIPSGVTSIGVMEFHDCTLLRSVTIPDSVTSIGRGAFYNCHSLRSFNFEGTKEQWNAVEKAKYWDANTGDYTINCTDGIIIE